MNSYAYILISKKDKKRYIGSTCNLGKRVKQHNFGYVKSTKNRRPLILFAYRKFDNIDDAVKFEKKYKNSSGQIQRDINNCKIKIVTQGVA